MYFSSLLWTPNPSEKIVVSALFSYRVQRDLYTILGKTSYIYTSKTYETPLPDSVHNSKQKTAIHLPM